ncbi:MAG: hypothetical protein IT438_16125 [Phycisphaerales bacterium]|nr:hypothetical protein [Phycisphaerales bacterium]
MILFHSADLLWAAKIKGTADALGIAARPVRTLEMLEARLADSRPVALLVDLDAEETALALIGRVREAERAGKVGNVRVLAYGPHVAVESMRRAKAAGADTVMARGGLSARMSSILKDLAAMMVVEDAAED